MLVTHTTHVLTPHVLIHACAHSSYHVYIAPILPVCRISLQRRWSSGQYTQAINNYTRLCHYVWAFPSLAYLEHRLAMDITFRLSAEERAELTAEIRKEIHELEERLELKAARDRQSLMKDFTATIERFGGVPIKESQTTHTDVSSYAPTPTPSIIRPTPILKRRLPTFSPQSEEDINDKTILKRTHGYRFSTERRVPARPNYQVNLKRRIPTSSPESEEDISQKIIAQGNHGYRFSTERRVPARLNYQRSAPTPTPSKTRPMPILKRRIPTFSPEPEEDVSDIIIAKGKHSNTITKSKQCHRRHGTHCHP